MPWFPVPNPCLLGNVWLALCSPGPTDLRATFPTGIVGVSTVHEALGVCTVHEALTGQDGREEDSVQY